MQAEHDLEFPLHPRERRGGAASRCELRPRHLRVRACLWCDPYKWIPEARRLLRPGGRLIFFTNAAFLMPFSALGGDDPVGETLCRPYFGMYRFEWDDDDDDSVEFHLPHGEMIDLLRSEGFEVEGLVEVRPPEDATSTYTIATLEWARKWPSEEVVEGAPPQRRRLSARRRAYRVYVVELASPPARDATRGSRGSMSARAPATPSFAWPSIAVATSRPGSSSATPFGSGRTSTRTSSPFLRRRRASKPRRSGRGSSRRAGSSPTQTERRSERAQAIGRSGERRGSDWSRGTSSARPAS